MSQKIEGKVVLQIDPPELGTATRFTRAKTLENVNERDRHFHDWRGGLLMTEMVIMQPHGGLEILRHIRDQWNLGETAWARQFLAHDDCVDLQIVALRVDREEEDRVVFQLYTPAETRAE